MTTNQSDAFLKFIAAARELLGPGDQPRPSDARTHARAPVGDEGAVVDRFTGFLSEARPLATRASRAYLTWFAPHAARIRAQLVPDDLILVAGHRHVENCYTRLVAWALGYKNPSPIAEAIQRRWLRRLLPLDRVPNPLRVIQQLQTDDGGTPDLALLGDDLVVVVEAKTRTAEHEAAQTGRPQTEAYLEATREALRVPADAPGWVIYLTMRGDEPANKAAVATTFVELALVILEALDGVSAENAWPYRSLASHWLLHAAPGVSVSDVAALACAESLAEGELLRQLAQVARLERFVPTREGQA